MVESGADDRASASFGPELFAFLAELKANNDRDWFNANKAPLRGRPARAGARLHRGLRAPTARDQPAPAGRRPAPGGSLFRIYRDTRFAKDKTPYKTQAGIYFRTSGPRRPTRRASTCTWRRGDVFAGGGIWHADTKTAHADPRRDRRATPTAGAEATAGIELGAGRVAQARPAGLRQGPPARRGPQAQGLRRASSGSREKEATTVRLPRTATRPPAGRSPADAASSAARSACRTRARSRAR